MGKMCGECVKRWAAWLMQEARALSNTAPKCSPRSAVDVKAGLNHTTGLRGQRCGILPSHFPKPPCHVVLLPYKSDSTTRHVERASEGCAAAHLPNPRPCIQQPLTT